ncbi:hypothetical protein RMATCC62417_15889 [Rhizopus microsporus]|nr:hypothetical protein RMATCC62417_15889 [Rhizopus microsporus]
MFEIAADEKNMKFVPGKKLLGAAGDAYNADATTVVDDLEVCILETSGKFQLKDKPRCGYDHVKGDFAALSLLGNIFQKYLYAKETTSQDLKLYVVHKKKLTSGQWKYLPMTFS